MCGPQELGEQFAGSEGETVMMQFYADYREQPDSPAEFRLIVEKCYNWHGYVLRRPKRVEDGYEPLSFGGVPEVIKDGICYWRTWFCAGTGDAARSGAIATLRNCFGVLLDKKFKGLRENLDPDPVPWLPHDGHDDSIFSEFLPLGTDVKEFRNFLVTARVEPRPLAPLQG
jgi:hypothetical protein